MTHHRKALAWLSVISLGVSFILQAADISPEQLKLHYDFGKAKEASVPDLSGNGHDGEMQGDFEKVKADGHAGVAFNMKNTLIRPAKARELRLNGPISIAMRIRITPEQAFAMSNGSPALFGAPDTRAILRNYLIFFDYGKRLQLDVGNGSTSSGLTCLDMADGKVHDIVYVVSPPMGWIYKDGQCVKETTAFNTLPTDQAGSEMPLLGCWKPGTEHFGGDLFELRLYNRALSYREVADFSNLQIKIEPKSVINCTYSAYRKALDWDVSVQNLKDEDGVMTVEIDGRQAGSVPYKKSQLIGERLTLSGDTPALGLAPGEHKVHFLFKDAKGRRLHVHEMTVTATELTHPIRFENTIGITDEVLPPWEPMTCTAATDAVDVTVWNRLYRFGAAPFAVDFFSGGENLMARSTGIELKLGDGAPESFPPTVPKVVSQAPHKVVLRQETENALFKFSATHTIEYDGFDRIQVVLTAKKDATVRSLKIRMPLDRRHATYSAPSLRQQKKIAAPIQYEFLPTNYIGDHDKGLFWMADSDQNWFPYNHTNAMTVTPEKEAILFDANLIDADFAVAAQQSLFYEFALEATPVRKFLGSAWERRVVTMVPYCQELNLLSSKRNGVPFIEDYARLGAKAFAVVRVERPFGYPTIPGSDFDKAMRPIINRGHELGMQFYPYTVSFVFSKLIPEWNERELFMLYPRKSYTDSGDTLELETGVKQDAFYACNNPFYQNLMLYRLKEAMEKCGVDGVYLDGTSSNPRCSNKNHGCGYLRADGQYIGTYTGFYSRDMLRRLYTLIWQLRGMKGGVDLHMSNIYNIAPAAWATTRFMGEGLPKSKLITQTLPPEEFLMYYSGRNIGTPVDFLTYTLGQPLPTSLALSMIHDTPARPHCRLTDIDILSEVWKIRDAFGCDQAEFIGYWEERCPVTAGGQKDIYVSVYRRQDNHLMAIISNLSGEERTVQLQQKQPQWTLPESLKLAPQSYVMKELVPISK